MEGFIGRAKRFFENPRVSPQELEWAGRIKQNMDNNQFYSRSDLMFYINRRISELQSLKARGQLSTGISMGRIGNPHFDIDVELLDLYGKNMEQILPRLENRAAYYLQQAEQETK